MAKDKLTLTKKNLLSARKVLFTVTKMLAQRQIVYHLEGGTLLGIVRDQNLLPWDYDVDISVPKEYVGQLLHMRLALGLKGYRMSIRKSEISTGPILRGDYSIIKIKPIKDYYLDWFVQGHKKSFVVLDVFVKSKDSNYTYWQAKNKVMRVDNKFYTSCESITYLDHQLNVPNHYKGYLTEKYGNWSVPIKKWDCGENELTIIKA